MTLRIRRREVLRGLAAAGAGALAASSAHALDADSRVGVAVLEHGSGYDARPGAVEELLWETTKRTSILVRKRPIGVKATDPVLFTLPLLLWLGNGDAPPFDTAESNLLGRWIRAGGLLLIDDASPEGADAFDAVVRRELARLLPGRPWVRLSNDHSVYRSFFLLERPFGRIDRTRALEGIDLDDRTAVLYSRNDLFGAFGRDPGGGWRLPVVPGGDGQREMALRTGINVLMYATCLSYKRDQVHVTEILRRRKWRVDDGGSVR